MTAPRTSSSHARRVLLVDDQAPVRRGLRALLETCEDIEVVGGASDGYQAVALADVLAPDVVLMDCRMPGMDGLEATRIIKRDRQETAVVALSMYPELESAARGAGADAFLVKGGPGADLVDEIRKVD